MMSGQQHQHCSVSGYYCCCYWVYAVFAVWGDWSVDRLNARQAIGFSIAYSLATLDDFCSPEWHEFSVNHFSAIVNWFGKKQTSDLWNSKQAYMLHVFYNFVFFVHIFIFSPLFLFLSVSLLSLRSGSRTGYSASCPLSPLLCSALPWRAAGRCTATSITFWNFICSIAGLFLLFFSLVDLCLTGDIGGPKS